MTTHNTVAVIQAFNLRPLREMAGLKQGEFARLLNISKQQLYHYEHAYKGVTLPTELAIKVQTILERRGLDLRTIASTGPLTGTAPGERALIKNDDKLDAILGVLIEIRELLKERD